MSTIIPETSYLVLHSFADTSLFNNYAKLLRALDHALIEHYTAKLVGFSVDLITNQKYASSNIITFVLQ